MLERMLKCPNEPVCIADPNCPPGPGFKLVMKIDQGISYLSWVPISTPTGCGISCKCNVCQNKCDMPFNCPQPCPPAVSCCPSPNCGPNVSCCEESIVQSCEQVSYSDNSSSCETKICNCVTVASDCGTNKCNCGCNSQSCNSQSCECQSNNCNSCCNMPSCNNSSNENDYKCCHGNCS